MACDGACSCDWSGAVEFTNYGGPTGALTVNYRLFNYLPDFAENWPKGVYRCVRMTSVKSLSQADHPLEFSAQPDKSPESVRARRLGANCANCVTRWHGCSDRLTSGTFNFLFSRERGCSCWGSLACSKMPIKGVTLYDLSHVYEVLHCMHR